MQSPKKSKSDFVLIVSLLQNQMKTGKTKNIYKDMSTKYYKQMSSFINNRENNNILNYLPLFIA
jgi:hypothetical protein